MKKRKRVNFYDPEQCRKEIDKRIEKLLKKELNKYITSSELYELTSLFEADRNLSP